MSDYFAQMPAERAGYTVPYQNKPRRNLLAWAVTSLILAPVIWLIVWVLLTRTDDPLSAEEIVIAWFFAVVGVGFFVIGVTCAVGLAVVNAVAYEQRFRFGPLPTDPTAAAEAARRETPRAAGTDEDPIPVDDNFIR